MTLLTRVSHSSVVRASNRYLEGHGLTPIGGSENSFSEYFDLRMLRTPLLTIILMTHSGNSLASHDARLDHAYFEISELSKPT